MLIDPRARDLGLDAVVAAVTHDQDQFLDAIRALEATDRSISDQVMPIYLSVGRLALLAIHDGRLPDREQNRETAHAVVEAERHWARLQITDVQELLAGLSSDEHIPGIPFDRFAFTVFVTVGHLLSAHHRRLGFTTIYDFLEIALERIEAETPAPQRRPLTRWTSPGREGP
jgi:hypothetical protein